MTLIVTGYASKKELKACIGKSLSYVETSLFGDEYKSNGVLTVVHRPTYGLNCNGREFFANVTMRDGLIEKVK